ncbi:MAG: hemerythrin domain-containing protein [Gammaproteobacteria bacterium]|nr:hemerythrin domain-containing protein [Gammaproteobacteria bacterium]MDH3375026.1 hemerythrin domain-containing protein [Gammaproteobacteria bacterium]
MTQLREDHRNMMLLLEMIETEANRLYRDEAVDLDLAHDIMIYMTTYPDAVHHPKEDRLYAELKAARPDLSQGMSKISAEHRSIAEKGLELRNSIEQVVVGQAERPNAVVANALRYVDALRSHMHWEEHDLFRRVELMIRDGHDVLDKAVFVQAPDPVFGPRAEQVFARLFDRIKKAR